MHLESRPDWLSVSHYSLEECSHPSHTPLKGAATTSNVFLELHGQQGKIGPLQLDSPTAFQRGKVDPDLDLYTVLPRFEMFQI